MALQLETKAGVGWSRRVAGIVAVLRHTRQCHRVCDAAKSPVCADGMAGTPLTERVLRVRQADSAFYQTVLHLSVFPNGVTRRSTHQAVAVERLDGIGSKVDILKLDKAHWPVDLLPEAHPLVAWARLEEHAKRLLEEVGRQRWRRDGWEIADVERVDLPRQLMTLAPSRSRIVKAYRWILVGGIGSRHDTAHAPPSIAHVVTSSGRAGSKDLASRSVNTHVVSLMRMVDRLRLARVASAGVVSFESHAANGSSD